MDQIPDDRPLARRDDTESSTSDDDVISLRPFLAKLWRYRRVVTVAIGSVCLLFLVAALGTWLVAPTERVASIQFRLLFEGAADGKYPNGAPFSPVDIVGAPVVTEVFRVNELGRFGTYEDMKEALFIQQSNPELDLIALEYQSKLADTKISSVDRARIEDEFRKKREALADPSYSLSLRRSERYKELPRELAQKTLNDILSTWARQAEFRKGALSYQIPMLSSAILSRESLENDDYLIAADVLRAKALRVIRTIDKIEELPGALTIRTAKDSVSLSEIRAGLEDSIRFDLEPLLGIIRSEGVTKNARLLSLYATNMVFQLRLDKQETEARARALQSALREYVSQSAAQGIDTARRGARGSAGEIAQPEGPAFVPQLSDSFLSRLQDMAAVNQKDEMEYRRKLNDRLIEESRAVATFDKELQYYEDLTRSLEGVGARSTGSPELVRLIRTRADKAFGTIERAIIRLSDLYHELSAQNLNPEARLFAITGPFASHSRHSVSLSSIFAAFVLVMSVTFILVPVGCLIHDAMRSRGEL